MTESDTGYATYRNFTVEKPRKYRAIGDIEGGYLVTDGKV